MRIINLTPHAVCMMDVSGNVVDRFASEGLARATETSVKVGEVNGFDIVETVYGEITGLPEKSDDTYYIVSLLTAQAAVKTGRGADDLLLTSDLVRDGEGRIIGCKRFARYC